MSKKDFIIIAGAIKRQMDAHPEPSTYDALVRSSLNNLANDLGAEFGKTNAMFDLHRFKVACGLIGGRS